jgi:hypothetical protein
MEVLIRKIFGRQVHHGACASRFPRTPPDPRQGFNPPKELLKFAWHEYFSGIKLNAIPPFQTNIPISSNRFVDAILQLNPEQFL